MSPGISFDWRCGPDMHCDGIGNFQMGGYVQSVVIEGTVYVGGGKASADRLNAYIMGFSSGKWFHLPRYKASFAMAAVKKKLVLVGGEDRLKKRVKLLAMWDPSAQTWTHPYPDMVTARSHCSAVAFKEWLIVAGGLDSGRNLLSSVEVLNTESKQWHAGPPTPLPWHSMKTAIVGDIGYFVGGETPESSNASINTLVYCLSSKNLLSMLQSKKNEKLEIWRELPEHPLGCSAPLSTGQCLFTVGGVDRDLEPMTDVYLYKPVTKSWEKVGDMQTPRCNCTCVAIMEVLVAGGFRDEHGKLNRVDIATLV